MNDLLEEKAKIESKIKECEKEKVNRQKQIKSINSNIKHKHDECINLNKEIQSIKTQIKEKEVKFKEMTKIIKKYKQKKKEKLKEKYIEKYNMYVEQLNKIKFIHGVGFEQPFIYLNRILKHLKVFEILYDKTSELNKEKKKELLEYLKKKTISNMKSLENVHELSFFISLAQKYEIFFDEKIFVDFIYENIEYSFHYHFLSERETNRLDKPEWFFNFLVEKLVENKRPVYLYNLSNKDTNYNSTDKLIEKIQRLVEIKFAQLTKQESMQKRNLIVHFALETSKFAEEIRKSYKIEVKFSNMVDFLIKQEKRGN